MAITRAVEIQGEIDDQHRLPANVPLTLQVGAGRVIVLVSEADEGGDAWAAGIASEWADELKDTHQDIYTLNDGQPVDAGR